MSIRDTDVIFNSFPKYCHEGQTKCSLYRKGDRLIDVTERFQEVLTDLKSNPIILVDSSNSPVVFTYDILKSLIFAVLYSPTGAFPILSFILNELYVRDYSFLRQMKWSRSPEDICGYKPPPWVCSKCEQDFCIVVADSSIKGCSHGSPTSYNVF